MAEENHVETKQVETETLFAFQAESSCGPHDVSRRSWSHTHSIRCEKEGDRNLITVALCMMVFPMPLGDALEQLKIYWDY